MPRKIPPYTPRHPLSSPLAPRLLLALLAVLLCGEVALGSTWYVKPSTEVPIRAGQGTEFKILAVAPDGMAVELLEEIAPWARVRTQGGTEGWLLKRYLSSEPPQANAVSSLQAEKNRLQGTSSEINRKLNELSQTHAQCVTQLEACRAERDEARQNYETLRQETADVTGTKNSLAEKTKELEETQARLSVAEQERSTLKRNTNLMWFLAGGLVLLCGWFLGSLSTKSRKRKTTLY